MESNDQQEKYSSVNMQLQDTYNDEYWAKKYGVSADDLKQTNTIGISARIIEANKKSELLHA